MQTKFLIKQWYPSLPKDFTPGTILQLYAPIVGFAYYSDVNDKHRITRSEVEDNIAFFEVFNREPKLEDFYDELDPRGCSTSEYNTYIKAFKDYENNQKGIVYGDTLIVGIGDQKIDPPYLYKTAEENNRKA